MRSELSLTTSIDTPLCPAGHLPHKEGDYKRRAHYPKTAPSNIQSLQMGWCARSQLISLLVGEMPGRAEGGEPQDSNATGSIIHLTEPSL